MRRAILEKYAIEPEHEIVSVLCVGCPCTSACATCQMMNEVAERDGLVYSICAAGPDQRPRLN